MNILAPINRRRRKIMHGITKSLSNYKRPKKNTSIKAEDIKKILLSRPNHRLGNQLLMTSLVQEINETFPQATIDLFVKGGLSPILYKNYKNIDRVIMLPKKHFKQIFKYLYCWFRIKGKRYDLVINVAGDSSSGKISTKLSSSTYKLFSVEDDDPDFRYKNEDYHHMAKYPIYGMRNYMKVLGIHIPEKDIPLMDLKLEPSELEKGRKLVENLITDKNKKTIALFTFATGAKCYSNEWWGELLSKLKTHFDNHNFVEVLPVENISAINFSEPSYYSKDIREIGAFIANTDIFIGADSGMMHLASASLTPTLGLFSVTRPERYRPFGNQSKAIDTNETDMNGIIREVEKILSL